jgi:predicted O-methyltransferase YrrM
MPRSRASEMPIHLLPGAAWRAYQHKRLNNLRSLGPALRLDRWLQERGINEVLFYDAPREWVAVHAWRRGFLPVGAGDLEAARALRDGRGDGGALAEAAATLGWCVADDALDMDGLLLRAILDFGALQNPWEVERFLERVVARRPRTIVEIGTSSGGLLFAMARLADPAALLVSIDVPESFDHPTTAMAVPPILRALVRPTQRLVLKRERSTIHSVRAEVGELLAGRPVDLLVIDGDHTYGGVRIDFEMYGDLVAPGGLIAFHDVLIRPENTGRGFEVGLFWDELARTHTTETIADPNGVPGTESQTHLPFTQRRPAALGWGLITV